MTQHINNGEFNLFTDIARIQTRCPPADVTDAMILMQAKRNRLPAGEPIIVQCFSHDGCDLLARCEYVVTCRRPFLRTVESGFDQSLTSEEFEYEIERISDWQLFNQEEKETVRDVTDDGETYVDGDCYRHWDVRNRIHEVRRRIDDSVVCVHADKATADLIAAGDAPLPEKVEAA